MKPSSRHGWLVLLVLGWCAQAGAEPVLFNTAIVTSGRFDCPRIFCGNEGTSSLTIGSGPDAATLTFTGVTAEFGVTNRQQRVLLGEFELAAPDGFIFPTHPANPELGIIRFFLTIDQRLPVDATRTHGWLSGGGGGATILFGRGSNYLALPTGGAAGYGQTIYTIDPHPFTIHPNARTTMFAEVGAVPEPATLILVGTGLAAAWRSRGRKVRAPGASPGC